MRYVMPFYAIVFENIIKRMTASSSDTLTKAVFKVFIAPRKCRIGSVWGLLCSVMSRPTFVSSGRWTRTSNFRYRAENNPKWIHKKPKDLSAPKERPYGVRLTNDYQLLKFIPWLYAVSWISVFRYFWWKKSNFFLLGYRDDIDEKKKLLFIIVVRSQCCAEICGKKRKRVESHWLRPFTRQITKQKKMSRIIKVLLWTKWKTAKKIFVRRAILTWFNRDVNFFFYMY